MHAVMCSWAVAVSAVAGLWTGGATAEELVSGVAARATALTSGRMDYTYKSESFVGVRALPVRVLKVSMAFSGSSWAERWEGTPMRWANHGGFYLKYQSTPQPDGSVFSAAQMSPPKALSSRDGEVSAPPLFAGGFWLREQFEYVEAHASECRLTGSEVVNDVPTEVCELTVPAKDHGVAFRHLFPGLRQGGAFRMYVAPQLGYVLPRIELVTPEGKVAQSYDAADFVEAAPGVFLPQRIWQETHLAAGGSRYRGEFTIRAELINEPIPEKDFVVELPLGTSIHDARDPEHVIAYRLTDTSPSSAIPELSEATQVKPRIGFWRRWRNSILVGVALGVVVSIVGVLLVRSRRSD